MIEEGILHDIDGPTTVAYQLPVIVFRRTATRYCYIIHLLFEIESDSLVMIDEPELSLNVVWQRNFLRDLQRIIELRKFDVLIATHSPMIIHDKWDWVVHLGEKVDD